MIWNIRLVNGFNYSNRIKRGEVGAGVFVVGDTRFQEC